MAKKKLVKKTPKKDSGVVKVKHAKVVKEKKSVSPVKKVPEEVKKEEPVLPVNKEPAVAPVFYQGIKIVRILDSGHNKTHKKCEGVDKNGNLLTLHVPQELL